MALKDRVTKWKGYVQRLKQETYALYLACRDPRVPWYARALALLVAAYAFSPIDLIPDFIPVFGYLDDLVLVPLGLMLALRLVPKPVMSECRALAAQELAQGRRLGWAAAVAIVVVWVALAAVCTWLIVRAVTR